jgi:N6-adenosine-specific RNA methylase IME4
MSKKQLAKSKLRQLALPGFRMTATALTPNKSLTEPQWEEAGLILSRIAGSLNWWIGDWLNAGERKWGKTYEEACARFGIEYQTARNLAYVASKVSLRQDKLSFEHHAAVAPLEAEEQEEWLEKAIEGDGEGTPWSSRELRAQIKAATPLPEITGDAAQYKVIYADPPWEYGDERSGLKGYSAAKDHYPTMSLEQLCGLGPRIAEISQGNSVLFLWATAPLLPDALTLANAWAFSYKSHFVWDKIKHNFGHYNSVRHELLLVAVRGSCVPEVSKLFDSVVSIERTAKHSEKPDQFYEIIETLYPPSEDPPRHVELFAREKRNECWGAMGNEL